MRTRELFRERAYWIGIIMICMLFNSCTRCKPCRVDDAGIIDYPLDPNMYNMFPIKEGTIIRYVSNLGDTSSATFGALKDSAYIYGFDSRDCTKKKVRELSQKIQYTGSLRNSYMATKIYMDSKTYASYKESFYEAENIRTTSGSQYIGTDTLEYRGLVYTDTKIYGCAPPCDDFAQAFSMSGWYLYSKSETMEWFKL